MDDYKSSIELQGEQTRLNQSHAAKLAEDAAERAHTRQKELLGLKYGLYPYKNSSRSSDGTEYSYDRPNVYFSKGKMSQITRTSEGAFKLGGKDIKDYTRLTIKRSTSNPSDISIYSGGRLLASYNASSSNKSDGVKYYDPSSKKYVARHGGAALAGTLEGLTATDIRNFARFVAENPGSENQYSYGITEDGELFSVQNSVQRVTKGLNNSADLIQDLWKGIGYNTGYDYSTYGQDDDLSVW